MTEQGSKLSFALRQLLTESLGEPIERDLFAGFLVALGGVLLANESAAMGEMIVADFHNGPAIVVPLQPPVLRTRFDDEIVRALAVNGGYRSVEEVFAALTLAVKPGLVESAGVPLRLSCVRIGSVHDRAEPESRAKSSLAWKAVRAILEAGPPIASSNLAILAAALRDREWPARMAAVLAVGRLRVRKLVRPTEAVALPPVGRGLRDDDRRALLALRDVAAARAAGSTLNRPVHPDPTVAAARAGLIAAVEAAVSGEAKPGPSSRAYILRALEDPDAIAADKTSPPEWSKWLKHE